MRLLIVCSLFLFSCVSQHDDYYNNLEIFKAVVLDINTYFEDLNLEDHDLDKYYTDDFLFHSYAAGNKKGLAT